MSTRRFHVATLIVVFGLILLSAPVKGRTDPARPNKFVGIMYATWFNWFQQYNDTTVYPTEPPHTRFMYWGVPALGQYASDNAGVINTHAAQIAAAGIDFIVIDFSNNDLADPLKSGPINTLLSQYQTRVSNGQPTPRVVFFVDTNANAQTLFNQIYQPYSASVFFNHGSKPLLLLREACSSQLVQTQFECRYMDGLGQTNARWSFLELTPQAHYTNGHWPEQMAVSPAQQETAMSITTAHGRKYRSASGQNDGALGANFLDQWSQANGTNPTFVILAAWNGWGAQNLDNPLGSNQNWSTYYDAFNPEFSNDIEPKSGNWADGQPGDYFLTLTTQQVAAFKRNSPMLFLRDSATGTWHIKYGRKGSQFAAQNFATTFQWSAGDSYQPVVGDFNNDGITDIGLRDTNSGTWYFGFGNGAGQFFNNLNFTWSSGNWHQPLVGDFNNDGITDIGLRDTNSGTWFFAFGNGSGQYSNTLNFNWSAGSDYQPLIGDFDNNGITDIGLRASGSGTWYFAFGNGSGQYFNNRNFSWSAGSSYLPVTGDFDCDGKTDIGLRATNGTIYLANFDGGSQYFNTSNYPFLSGGTFSVHADPLACR